MWVVVVTHERLKQQPGAIYGFHFAWTFQIISGNLL